ncbi:MAG TPA: alpha/beta hydrolase [Xanthobacteraceae bacterium]|jgi:pimeloyl-ACP methyl ester carboxylesterase|nr:alpha/beta hydrolase [Xanthobacteraceae bacterium]
MPSFQHANIDIAYIDEGEGEPIVLVHGFASNKEINWILPGWTAALKRAGRRVIALDNRGHGQSSKPHDPAAYDMPSMAGDTLALLDHLKVERADYLGYSMGGRIGMHLALHHPDRIRSSSLGGIGASIISGPGRRDQIIAALEAKSAADITDPVAKQFRVFAEQTKSDLQALIACMGGLRVEFTEKELASNKVPMLIVRGGDDDDIAGPAAGIARIIPGCEYIEVPHRNHMTVVGDRIFKDGVLAFLEKHGQ